MTEMKGRRALSSVILLGVGIAATGSLALAIPMPHPVAPSGVSRPVQSGGQVIVHVTSVGMHDVQWNSDGTLRGEVLIYTTGGAKVGLGSGELKAIRDTLHLKTLPAFTADVTDGEVHIKLIGSEDGTIELKATVTGGPAKSFAGKDSYLVLMKGGVGIKTMAVVPPLFIVDGVRTTQDLAMRIPQDSMSAVEVLKGEAARAKYGDEGKHGVVIITTKRTDARKARPAAVAQPAESTDSANLYFEDQVDEPALQVASKGAPKYPAAERAAGTVGTVEAQFIVGTDGLVEPGSFRVIGATDLGPDGSRKGAAKPDNDSTSFDIAVRALIPTLRFTPAKLKGVKVRQVCELPFIFAIPKK